MTTTSTSATTIDLAAYAYTPQDKDSNGGNTHNAVSSPSLHANETHVNNTTVTSSSSSEAGERLSQAQQTVLHAVERGENVFFTGSAGTGKSHVLRLCVQMLRTAARIDKKRQTTNNVYVTAPTGIAACNVGGITLHSFAGIGKGEGTKDELVGKVERDTRACRRWCECKVLVIDEISMVDADMFDTLDAIARTVRQNDHVPFGGIQLVLCGDFYQLPPVSLSKQTGAKFCFDSTAWKDSIQHVIELTHSFRQRGDDTFVRILNEIRKGHVSDGAVTALHDAGEDVQRHKEVDADIRPTMLYALNKDVDRINQTELDKCDGDEKTFDAKDTGRPPYVNQLKNGCLVPACLRLRIGAQVILLKNLEPARGLVNGTRGTVVGFCPPPSSSSSSSSSDQNKNNDGDSDAAEHSTLYPRVKFLTHDERILYKTLVKETWSIESNGTVVASREQIPLKLAYALSIHKSQGMTIDLMECSMRGIFAHGQAYVALSRATNLSRLRVIGFTRSAVKAHPRVTYFYENLVAAGTNASRKRVQSKDRDDNDGNHKRAREE